MTPSKFVVGIDLLGGDLPPEEILIPLVQMLSPEAKYRLYITKKPDYLPPFIEPVVVSEVIGMEDHPILAAKHKKNSSLAIGLQELALKKTDAFITHGNTGALLALARRILTRLSVPALVASTTKGVVLDVGANMTATCKILWEFTLLGIAFQKSLGLNDPRVGLLNIGSEATKGRIEHRAFHKKPKPFHFVGNIESQDIFDNKADVIVTDGFSGNLLLKTVEASFRTMQTPLPFRKFPGAILGGLDRLVIKCHGSSPAEPFFLAVQEALSLLEKEFLNSILHILRR